MSPAGNLAQVTALTESVDAALSDQKLNMSAISAGEPAASSIALLKAVPMSLLEIAEDWVVPTLVMLTRLSYVQHVCDCHCRQAQVQHWLCPVRQRCCLHAWLHLWFLCYLFP